MHGSRFFGLMATLAWSLPALLSANPNFPGAEPRSTIGEIISPLIGGQRFVDNWGNQYTIVNSPVSDLNGHMATLGCTTEQLITGKVIGTQWVLVVASTLASDCIGGMLEVQQSASGLEGTWTDTEGRTYSVTLHLN